MDYYFVVPTDEEDVYAVAVGTSPPEALAASPHRETFATEEDMLHWFDRKYPSPHPALTCLYSHHDHVLVGEHRHFGRVIEGKSEPFVSRKTTVEMVLQALHQYGHVHFHPDDEHCMRQFVRSAGEPGLTVRTKKYDGLYRVVNDAKVVARRAEHEAKKAQAVIARGEIPLDTLRRFVLKYAAAVEGTLPSCVKLAEHPEVYVVRGSGWSHRRSVGADEVWSNCQNWALSVDEVVVQLKLSRKEVRTRFLNRSRIEELSAEIRPYIKGLLNRGDKAAILGRFLRRELAALAKLQKQQEKRNAEEGN